MLSKKVNNKKCAPKFVFFDEKTQIDSDDFWKSNFGPFWQLATTPILQIW